MRLLTALSIIIFLFGIFLQIFERLAKTDSIPKIIISYILIGVPVVLFIITLIQNRISKVKLNQFKDVFYEDLMVLKKQLYNSSNSIGDIKHEGISYNLLLKIGKNKRHRDKYIVDTGENNSKNRISIFLDKNNYLNFRIIGELNDNHKIKIKASDSTFQFGRLFNLICEYGINDQSSFIRIILDGKIVANETIDTQIDIPYFFSLTNSVLGANLDYKKYASFSTTEIIIRKVTYRDEDVAQLLEYFEKKPNNILIAFSNKDFMFIDESNNWIQPKKRHKPKLLEL